MATFGKTWEIGLILLAIGILGLALNSEIWATSPKDMAYGFWQNMGERAAKESLKKMKEKGVKPKRGNLIVMSNAGYAEVNGYTTQAALDGLTRATGASRGRFSLLEIHSAPNTPLWFAIYDKASGLCSYLQMNSSVIQKLSAAVSGLPAAELFSINAIEDINAEHLYANALEYNEKFSKGIFGGNEFRIITIANAMAKNAPAYAARAFEFHDHYCPGVTSGILMVNYLKKQFPLTSGGSYFVQAIQPWCKEDALMVLLNATPGKSGYAADYASAADMATWKPEAKGAATIVYRKNGTTKKWDGVVLGFTWADTGCPDYGAGSMMTKLCMDLWYLERMDQPEAFVKEIKRFDLPEGLTPKDWSRPGVDPMKELGLVQ